MRCPRCQQEYRQTTGLRVWSPDATRFHAPIPARVDTDIENEAGGVCQLPVVHLADLFAVHPRRRCVSGVLDRYEMPLRAESMPRERAD
jgi:hypothetical protein